MRRQKGFGLIGILLVAAVLLAIGYFAVTAILKTSGSNGSQSANPVEQAGQAEDQVREINNERQQTEDSINEALKNNSY